MRRIYTVLKGILAAQCGRGVQTCPERSPYRACSGCLGARQSPLHLAAAACFQRALDIARHQQAKSPGIAGATSLARLGRGRASATTRADCCRGHGWFTRASTPADMQEAKALLDALCRA